jgi:hypothetical protein
MFANERHRPTSHCSSPNYTLLALCSEEIGVSIGVEYKRWLKGPSSSLRRMDGARMPFIQRSISFESSGNQERSHKRPLHPNSHRPWITFAALFAAICILGAAVLGFWREQLPTSPVRRRVTLNCGNSTAEAEALGCQFDPLSFLWLPAPCLDLKSTLEYQKRVNWHGYDDDQGSRQLSLQEMAARVGPEPYYTTAREHVVHCAYMWMRMHQKYLAGGFGLDDNARSFVHTQHCAEMLIHYADADPRLLNRLETKTTVGFSKCEVEV